MPPPSPGRSTTSPHVVRGASQRRAVVVVDDLDLLDDIGLADTWARLAAVPGLRIVASVGDVAAMTGFSSNPVIDALRQARAARCCSSPTTRASWRRSQVPGGGAAGCAMGSRRGVLVADRSIRVLQVAEQRPGHRPSLAA